MELKRLSFGMQLRARYWHKPLSRPANDWQFVGISPVDVQAGTSYIVSVYFAGSGASYRIQIQTLPQTYGDIMIEASLFGTGDALPTVQSTSRMYGQADIGFVAGGTGGNQSPVITTTAVTTATENTNVYLRCRCNGCRWRYTDVII